MDIVPRPAEMEASFRMKVSVVVPVFNKEAFLQECIDSIQQQTFKGEMEVIAVDDASTDRSAEILRSLKDPRWKVISSGRNIGPGMAAQLGHDHARGEYIIRVDADDIQHPRRIEEQVHFMDSEPHIGISGSYLRLHGTDQVRKRPLTDAECRVELLFGVAVHQPSMILRRSVLTRHGISYEGHWPRYGEDWLFQLRVSRSTRSANIPRPLVEYRAGGISSNVDEATVNVLIGEVFAFFDRPVPNSRQIKLHRMIAQQYPVYITPGDILAFKGWLEHIGQWKAVQHMGNDAFRRRTEKAWDDLFFRLPQQGLSSVQEWRRNGGKLTLPKLYYLVRTMNWTGRSRGSS